MKSEASAGGPTDETSRLDDAPAPDEALALLGERLREIRNGASQDRFAAELGVHKNTLKRYENGERAPDALFLQRVCARYQRLSPSWVLTGEGSTFRLDTTAPGETLESDAVRRLLADFVLVPPLEADESIDVDAQPNRQRAAEGLAYKRSWISKVLGVEPDGLRLTVGRGDSMEPTISNGHVLLVDTSQREVTDDAMYVLKRDRYTIAKRLQHMYDGSVHVKSDNPAYDEEIVPAAEAGKLEIMGRVVWVGGKI